MQTNIHGTAVYNVTLPNGDAYAIPHDFLESVHWTEIFDEFDDPLDFGTNQKNGELAAALAALALVQRLENKTPFVPDDDLPVSIQAAVENVLQKESHKVSFDEFINSVVPEALNAQSMALESARIETISFRWLDHIRDWYGPGVKVPAPLPGTWLEPTARLELAYRYLRVAYSTDELTSAIAGVMRETLFST